MDPVIACLDQVWSSIEELCSELTPAQWSRPTDLPGWTVQDCVSHLCGIESILLGREQPAPLAKPWPEHVHNDIGAMNEAQIEARRSLAPEDVLCEFMELTAERLKVLTELSDAELSAESPGVMGRAPLRDVLAIRVVDCFYHEQDIRRAVDRPGGLEGDVPRLVYSRMRAALPMIVGKKAGVADGSTVAIEIDDVERMVIGVRNGRASFVDDAKPDATIAMDLETFFCLTGGRRTRERAAKRVRVEGDAELGEKVLGALNILF